MDSSGADLGTSLGGAIWHVTMSVDGYIAGPDDEMDWVFEYGEADALADEVVKATGAVLMGRRSYDIGQESGTGVFGGGWSGPRYVLTNRPPEPGTDPAVVFTAGDVRAAVATALVAAEGRNVVVIGASVARQCIEARVIDEIVIHLAPVLLGAGVRFFESVESDRIALERTGLAQSGRITDLGFRVVK